MLVGLVVILGLMDFFQRTVQVCLENGDLLRFEPPSLLASVRGASCKIICQPKSGETSTIELWQDLYHGVITVVPTPDRNVILCLYEFDTDLRLLRIDRAQKLMPFPTTGSSCLSAVVCASPWDIQEARLSDWQETLSYLKKASPRSLNQQTLNTWRLGRGRRLDAIQRRMAIQIKLMVDNGAAQWPVTTTVR